MSDESDPLDGERRDSLLLDRLDLLAHQLPAIFAGTLAVIALLTYSLGDAYGRAVYVWAAILLTLTALRFGLNRWFLRERPTSRQARHWAWLMCGFSGLSGALWGFTALAYMSVDHLIETFVVLIVLCGMVGGSVAALSTHLPVYLAFLLPCWLPVVYWLFTAPPDEFKLLGIAAVFYLFVNLAYGRNVQRTVDESLRLRYENLELLDDLREQKNIAEQANIDKSRFLAAASHDLRQPLHALSLHLDTLEARLEHEQDVELLGNGMRALETLRQLFNALLDVSRLDAGIVEPTPRHFDLARLCNEISDEYAGQAAARNLEFERHIAPGVALTDPVLVGRVIRNLVGNAVHYTETGTITLAVEDAGQSLQVIVEDTGVGIPESAREDVFKEFFQLDNPERDRSKGLGLGLAIVRRLCALLDITYRLESRRGAGTTFTLTLPSGDRALIEPEAPAERSRFDFHGATVLVVDDETAILDGMRALLTQWACETHQATSSEQALEMMDKGLSPDILISDFSLPGDRSGLDTIIAARRICGQMLPALLITGDTAPERLQQARDHGIPLLHKPVQAARLRVAMARAMNPV